MYYTNDKMTMVIKNSKLKKRKALHINNSNTTLVAK